ncbi:alpha/beta hydrolase [Ammoniphilus sp. YIM 78166]|uniref:alpha/beta hydrolase n=1 Tax=Ammoniphilus sp. YIM 78166 TaxID=1644106 RepID=UPI00106FC5AB|nr:alpha/beta fold hydrolase [Ammoniphilus sp. YIM 78166]
MNNFTELEVIFESSVELYGTITLPQDEDTEHPAVIIIPGSGPVDRNGNIGQGKLTTNLYQELAHLFADQGYVTLRYDKRGTGKSGGEYLSTGFWDLVHDAEEALLFLQQHPQVDSSKIVLAGHSEGTVIVTAVAERKSQVAGIMLLSGGVDNLGEALVHQRKRSYKELKSKKGVMGWFFRRVIDEEKQEKKVFKQMKPVFESDKDVVKIQGFFKQPAKWLREHYAYNTREALSKISCPILAIQGDKDPLVENEVLKELAELAAGPSEYYIIPDMEHALKEQQEPRTILNYKKVVKDTINKPIHPLAKEKMLSWLERI